MIGLGRLFHRRPSQEEDPPLPKSRRPLYVEAPCIGCLLPFRRWGVKFIPLIDQFCSKRCERSFFHGYKLGLRVLDDVRARRQR